MGKKHKTVTELIELIEDAANHPDKAVEGFELGVYLHPDDWRTVYELITERNE